MGDRLGSETLLKLDINYCKFLPNWQHNLISGVLMRLDSQIHVRVPTYRQS